MYLENTTAYYDGTIKKIRRGNFLILVQSDKRPLDSKNFRGFVRKVAMEQCGHFMMGFARIYGKTFTLSGAYGNDGSPVTVPEEIFNKAVPIPTHLYNAWEKGGGWNSAGSEAEQFRKFGLSLIKKN